jgi:hypothetical protein
MRALAAVSGRDARGPSEELELLPQVDYLYSTLRLVDVSASCRGLLLPELEKKADAASRDNVSLRDFRVPPT